MQDGRKAAILAAEVEGKGAEDRSQSHLSSLGHAPFQGAERPRL